MELKVCKLILHTNLVVSVQGFVTYSTDLELGKLIKTTVDKFSKGSLKNQVEESTDESKLK